MTRWPLIKRVTLGPTSSTTPAVSQPRINGYVLRHRPCFCFVSASQDFHQGWDQNYWIFQSTGFYIPFSRYYIKALRESSQWLQRRFWSQAGLVQAYVKELCRWQRGRHRLRGSKQLDFETCFGWCVFVALAKRIDVENSLCDVLRTFI